MFKMVFMLFYNNKKNERKKSFGHFVYKKTTSHCVWFGVFWVGFFLSFSEAHSFLLPVDKKIINSLYWNLQQFPMINTAQYLFRYIFIREKLPLETIVCEDFAT